MAPERKGGKILPLHVPNQPQNASNPKSEEHQQETNRTARRTLRNRTNCDALPRALLDSNWDERPGHPGYHIILLLLFIWRGGVI